MFLSRYFFRDSKASVASSRWYRDCWLIDYLAVLGNSSSQQARRNQNPHRHDTTTDKRHLSNLYTFHQTGDEVNEKYLKFRLLVNMSSCYYWARREYPQRPTTAHKLIEANKANPDPDPNTRNSAYYHYASPAVRRSHPNWLFLRFIVPVHFVWFFHFATSSNV